MSDMEAKLKAYVDQKLAEKDKTIKKLENRLHILEADEDRFYPQDTYALISWTAPGSEEERFWSFAFGVGIWAFQMLFIGLLLASVFCSFFAIEDFTPGDKLMQFTEFAAIINYALIPDESIQDMVTAYQLWPAAEAHKNVLGRKIACSMRFLQGFFASVAVLFLINISPNAVDIILNFAALNFVSAMDSTAFDLASRGVFSHVLQGTCQRIAEEPLPERVPDKHNAYRFTILFTMCGMLAANAILVARPDWAFYIYTSRTIEQPVWPEE